MAVQTDTFEDVVAVLGDLLSVKVPRETRDWLLDRRQALKDGRGLSLPDRVRVRRLAGRYQRLVQELHAARERARATNARRRAGMTTEDVAARVAARTAERNDLGF